MTLRYPYEVRDEAEYFADIPDVKVPGEMLKLAEHIVETKAGDFDPSEFVDHYEEAVVDLLKHKQAGKAVSKGRATQPNTSNVVNLMDALKRSVATDKGDKAALGKPRQSRTTYADSRSSNSQSKAESPSSRRRFLCPRAKPRRGRADEKPLLVPEGFDTDVYVVLEEFHNLGRVYREVDEEAADRETLTDLMDDVRRNAESVECKKPQHCRGFSHF